MIEVTGPDEHGCAYVGVQPRPPGSSVRQEEIGRGIIVDFDASGDILGVEFVDYGPTTGQRRG